MLQLLGTNGRAPSLSIALLTLAIGLFLAYCLGWCFYQLFLNPLRRFPGPKLWSVSNIPYVRMYLAGNGHRRMLELHEKYGPIVRIGPDFLSINHPDGMREVRGHRKTPAGENPRDPVEGRFNYDNIIGSDRFNHQRMRRSLAHAFSAQSMLEQQPIIMQYVNTLIDKLHEEARDGTRPLNITKWLNFATFDVIGDLSFGEPFGCLESKTYHPWIETIFHSFKNQAYMTNIRRLSWLEPLLMLAIPRDLVVKFAKHRAFTHEKVKKRLALGEKRPDFMEAMVSRSESAGGAMTFDELASNASVLIIGGSETTATLLSAATFFLATHPETLEKLKDELRSTFTSEGQIDMISVQDLTYMQAVLRESMRLYPPVPSASPRTIAEGGDTILGEYLPEGTTVDVWQWAIYHNPKHFSRAEDFIPERWLGDDRFVDDARTSLQPFSTGPRDCIGKNLAYAEMRLILARLIWNFDIRLSDDSRKWCDDSQVFVLWQKPDLNVYLVPRKLSG
ncbi:trichothecene c-15 hydroxylase [Colletotrichum karsti]|uniref:Trichothecene c-15 hydroxylase n=1 Tax=Colletotrichum karsti TaxID=1095194 RepID=A0A9P6I6R7_9PEZI|nr:trichothecene c-15 hydroxylase [Colletotrichum karsti]KAF9876101.1 trichothecene c-15 hydroxylase [Colletotrichum karsti]